jgi:hypothetical protein
MLRKIVWLWYDEVGNKQWRMSVARWSDKLDWYLPTVTYTITIDRADIIHDIMYKMAKLGVCTVPHAHIKYSGATCISVRVN